MRIISIVNQKGGCGKTTTAINLSACLALKNKKVLLLDLDPQAHATIGLGFKSEEIEKSIYNIFSNEATIDEAAKVAVPPNLYIVPSNIAVSAIEQIYAGMSEREKQLKNRIADMKGEFDFVIMDCPPNIGMLTFNALVASTEVLVPVETGFFSLQGVKKLLEMINILKEHLGHQLPIKILPTLHDRRIRNSQLLLMEIYRKLGDISFKTVININDKLKEAASRGKPITEYSMNSSGFKDYMGLAFEVLSMSGEIAQDQEVSITIPSYKKAGIVYLTLKEPVAADVKLAGDFNNWIPDGNVITHKEDGETWNKILYLKPGVYQYRFIIDGNWKEDPNNPHIVENPYGGLNSIMRVEETL